MNRYPGVSPFSAEQSAIFFGRERDLHNLLKLIKLRKQVVLFSKSGVGKSSLINAGIIPQLRKDYHVIKVRFFAYNSTLAGSDEKESHALTPVQTVTSALEKSLESMEGKEETVLDFLVGEEYQENSLWFTFKQAHLKRKQKYVLIFDQFEELFTYPEDQIAEFKEQIYELMYMDIPDRFMDLISRDPAIEGHPQVEDLYDQFSIKSLISIRSSKLSLLNRLKDKLSDIFKYNYELTPLSNEQAKVAILNPARYVEDHRFEVAPFEYEEGAIEKIIDSLSNHGKQAIEATQLQIVCQKIEKLVSEYQKSQSRFRSTTITVSEEDLPDFSDIFISFYKDIIDRTSEKEEVRKFIEEELIREGQRISMDTLVCESFIKKETLNELVNAHLLRGGAKQPRQIEL